MHLLSVRRVLRASLRAWRRDFLYLTVLAAIVEAPIVLIELALHTAPGIDISTDVSAQGTARLITLGVPIVVYGILAHHFLSGVMEAVEGAERQGHDRPTLLQLARTLPWTKLLIADIVVNVILVLAFVAFVIPGILAGVYLAIALPLTNMERQPIGATIKRSVALTRGHFWPALLIWVITSVVIDAAQTGASELLGTLGHSTMWEFIAHLSADVLFLPAQALPIVMMAFDLVTIGRDRLPPPVGAPAHG